VALYGLTIFVGSFLLFQIQPVLGKLLLPVQGGTAGVWTVCLLFFQAFLLAGYAWAHFARPRWHAGLLLISLLWLPLSLRQFHGGPTASIFVTLVFSAGLPYAALAATSPLLQRWLGADRAPYRLYALSNLGSMLALLSYPLLIEPWLSLRHQLMIWTAGYVVFVGSCVIVAWRSKSPPQRPRLAGSGPVWLWIALAACGSALLMATTNQMSQEIAPMPFLWILPLALYLLSFIVCFGRPNFYTREWIGILCGLAIVSACLTVTLGTRISALVQIGAPAVTLFVCLLVCHGELVRARPAPESLTLFYLAIALGGAIGGVLVALVAPMIFTRYLEYPVALIATCFLGVVAAWRERGRFQWDNQVRALALGAATCSLLLSPNESVDASRNFYGTLRVTEGHTQAGLAYRLLTHGQTTHGLQFLDKDSRRQPTAYYGWNSAAGIILAGLPENAHIGLVGLGAGTLARYGKAGQTVRIYELDPGVIHMARHWFTYLSDSPARIDIVEGDARIRLRDEPAQGFDVLAVDAFSSDSIPVHLLTSEAAVIYRRHLKDDGILLIHVSNRMLKLEPVVAAMARRIGWSAQYVHSAGDATRGTYDANWMVLAHRPLPVPGARAATPNVLNWTDDFASVWRVLE
jgi:spermidine synthase